MKATQTAIWSICINSIESIKHRLTNTSSYHNDIACFLLCDWQQSIPYVFDIDHVSMDKPELDLQFATWTSVALLLSITTNSTWCCPTYDRIIDRRQPVCYDTRYGERLIQPPARNSYCRLNKVPLGVLVLIKPGRTFRKSHGCTRVKSLVHRPHLHVWIHVQVSPYVYGLYGHWLLVLESGRAK